MALRFAKLIVEVSARQDTPDALIVEEVEEALETWFQENPLKFNIRLDEVYASVEGGEDE